VKLNVYSIFDSAAGAYVTPFFMHSDGLAIRVFQSNINGKDQSQMSMYPDQFTLYKIGVFDDTEGSINRIDPLSLGNGIGYQDSNLGPADVDETRLARIEKEVNRIGSIIIGDK